jgi:hypothetical protein
MLPPVQSNPLTKYFRQAKIFIKLPSQGKYYPANSITIPESGEFAVYSMTAKDELMMKIPDALINGESTIEIIKSCMPNIIDPWKMPSIDTDAILIAIRIATFGEMLEITSKVPVIGEERTFQIDLRNFLDQLISFEYEPLVQINDDITIEVRPLTYKEFTENALKTFEEQRIFKLVTDDTIPDDKKLQAFTNSFKKLTNLTIDMIVNSVNCIDTPDGKVYDKKFIREFFNNADKEVFNKLMKHLETLKEKTTIKPLKVKSTQEDIDRGVPEEYEIPITFDQSNFFV